MWWKVTSNVITLDAHVVPPIGGTSALGESTDHPLPRWIRSRLKPRIGPSTWHERPLARRFDLSHQGPPALHGMTWSAQTQHRRTSATPRSSQMPLCLPFRRPMNPGSAFGDLGGTCWG